MLGQAAHLSITSEHAGGMTIEQLANTIVAKSQLSDDETFKALMYHVPANVDHPGWSYTTHSGNTYCSIWLSRDVRSKQPNSCRPQNRICAKKQNGEGNNPLQAFRDANNPGSTIYTEHSRTLTHETVGCIGLFTRNIDGYSVWLDHENKLTKEELDQVRQGITVHCFWKSTMTSPGIPNKFNILKRATRDASRANHYPRAEFDLNDIVYRIFKSAEYT